jgi:large subunit ribosomal protein L23
MMTTVYDILRRPIITEKSNYQAGTLNQVVFEVDRKATKAMVKMAVETLYDVTVERVNIMVVPAKRSRRGRSRRMLVRRPAYKKAIVTLAPGSSINIFEGVK